MRNIYLKNNFRVPLETDTRRKWSESLQAHGFLLNKETFDNICWLHFKPEDIKLIECRKPNNLKYRLEEGALPQPIEVPESE